MALRRRRAPNPWEEDVFETPSRAAPEPRVLEPRIRRAPQVTENPFGGGPFEGTLTAGPPTSMGQVRRGGLDGGPFIGRGGTGSGSSSVIDGGPFSGGPDDWQLDDDDDAPPTGPSGPPIGPLVIDDPEDDEQTTEEEEDDETFFPPEDEDEDEEDETTTTTGPVDDDDEEGPFEEEEDDTNAVDDDDETTVEDESDDENRAECEQIAAMIHAAVSEGTTPSPHLVRRHEALGCSEVLTPPEPVDDDVNVNVTRGPFYDSMTPLGAANVARYGVGPTNFESRLRRVLEQRGAL